MAETSACVSRFGEKPACDVGELHPVVGRWWEIVGTQAKRAGNQKEIFLNLHFVLKKYARRYLYLTF